MIVADKLLESIDSTSLAVSTDSLDISFGEIASMYDGGELEIRPTYQRLFRWSLTQQSQFMEFLLLGLPIPAIFVVETESRKYELIDGLQRISSYLHFIGILKNNDKYADNDKLRLRDCEIVSELNGLTIEDISPVLRIKIKRSYVKMYVIKKESSARIKYDMFKRLNTGGSLLEAQEIRSSTMRFLNPTFIDFIQQLSQNKHFKNTITYIQESRIEQQYDDELVLRFFTLKNGNLSKYEQGNSDYTLADYLTKFAEDISDKIIPFDYEKEAKIFEKTVEILDETLGKEVFANASKDFYAFYFEAFSIAVAELGAISVEKTPSLKAKILALKQDTDFQEYTQNEKHKRTSGSNYLEYLFKRLDLAKKYFSNL